MKKVLALVLAVMMMATVAFAATHDWVKPVAADQYAGNGSIRYGDKIVIDSGDLAGELLGVLNAVQKDITTDNYTVTSVKYNEGRNLIKSVAINDDDATVEVKLIDNYTATRDKTFDLEFTLKGKGKNKPTTVDFRVTGTVKNTLSSDIPDNVTEIEAGSDTIKLDNVSKNVVYKVVGVKGPDGKDYKYATLELTASDADVEVDVRVYDGDKLYLYNDQDADKDVLKKYADTDADLTFLNFPGTPEFNATASVRFYKDEGTYIYENKGNGVLSPITAASAGAAGQVAGNVKWDDDEGCYILKTRKLTSYVFSDKKLAVSAAATGATTTNPDTGANDVVGIASALATVALVSAAAVSLKK